MKLKSFFYFLCYLILVTGCSKDEVEPSFTIETTDDITVSSDNNSQGTISFTSAREWQATANSNWLSVSPAQGDAGTFELTVTASENKTTSDRTGTVTLTSKTLTQTFTILQEAAEYVTLEQAEYSVAAGGESLEIRFTTNVSDDDLSIKGYGSWLTQNEETRAANSYVIRLYVLANTDTSTRTAYVKFFNASDKELASVTITQEGTTAGESTDYSADKTVRILQTASKGNGIPIVIMGDGFIDTNVADGTYDKVMDKAMENLFTEEPMKSLRDYFNIYAVTAVSQSNVFGKGKTVFSCALEGGGSTGISGDDDAVMEYVQSVDGIDLAGTLAVIILNSSAYAGTTYFGYSQNSTYVEFAIAYCPIIYDLENESFRQVLVHEAVGHGFAKLDDEYAYESQGTIPDSEIKKVQTLQAIGWAQNVDFTTDTSAVLWAQFLSDSRYTSEGLGIYEGACTYIKGAYRPSEESMMRSNTTGFNAPSRKSIYDKVMKEGMGTQPTYEEFVIYDLQTQTKAVSRSASISDSRRFALPRFRNKPLVLK